MAAGVFKQRFEKLPVTAATAVASPRVKQEVLSLLHLKDARLFHSSFRRDNIAYRVERKADNAMDKLAEFISKSHPGTPTAFRPGA